MSICADLYRNAALMPRRVRKAECAAFENQLRWINLYCAFNLTADPTDNQPVYGAWTAGDMPVSVAWQDVDDRGGDLLFVASANRVYVLDWTRYRDEVNWETFVPIYRRLTLGPIPGSREAQEGGGFDLAGLKRFRRLTFQLATAPTDENSQYRIAVQEDGADEATAAAGYRTTARYGDAKVAHKGYTFLATLEHEANEDFPMTWWQAEYENLGGRRAGNVIP